MSNFDNTVENVPDAPIQDGQADAIVETGEALQAEPKEYFAWDEYGDKSVKIVVDGEEIDVPLSEALSGYQRQADYTRKTQQLAEQRREVQFAAALQEALQNDPSSTVELLSQHYGVNQQQLSEEDELMMDPMEKQYRQLENRIQAFEQDKAMRELENQIESLSRRYGETFDANEVVAKALATGSTDLEATYKQIAFDRLFDKTRSQEFATKVKDDETKRIVESKRDAAIVSKGSSAKSADVSSKPIRSVRDAYESAKRQLEG